MAIIYCAYLCVARDTTYAHGMCLYTYTYYYGNIVIDTTNSVVYGVWDIVYYHPNHVSAKHMFCLQPV